MRDDAVFGDDDDAVADEIKGVVHVFRFAGGGDDDVVADAGILINDGVFDAGVSSDADAGAAAFLAFVDGGDGIRNNRSRDG